MSCCIRGAITVEENNRECILENTRILLNDIINTNNLNIDDIISIIFTATKDIDTVYPAIAAREIGITNAGLMCMQEMYVKGSLEMCIRVLFTVKGNKPQKDIKHIYLKKAASLRPDLIYKKTDKKFVSVAIDGPAGSGKSTIAKEAAKELDFIYLDTGAMYRAVALYRIQNNIDTKNITTVENSLDKINIALDYYSVTKTQRIYLNCEDVSDKIRTQTVAAAASDVAAIEAVRTFLVDLQRDFAANENIIMDGRDIGTCVLPNASVKIYMDADVSERTKRRCNELKEKGLDFDFEKVKEEIITRDENDKNRKISPLKMADDAILIDSTNKSIKEVKNEVIRIIKLNLK